MTAGFDDSNEQSYVTGLIVSCFVTFKEGKNEAPRHWA